MLSNQKQVFAPYEQSNYLLYEKDAEENKADLNEGVQNEPNDLTVAIWFDT